MPSYSPPSPVTTGARSGNDKVPIKPGLRCWAKFVRGKSAKGEYSPDFKEYKGEYGFDWMDWERDPDPKKLNDLITHVQGIAITEYEYYYDARAKDAKGEPNPHYISVASDEHLKRKLQDQYPRITIYQEDYYAARLSMRPGQQNVTLQLAIEALNGDEAKGDYLTFGPHEHYKVTVNGQVNEEIRLPLLAKTEAKSPQLVDITIECKTACGETKLKVLDKNGDLMGQLHIVANDKTYLLPLRVVYLVRDKQPATDLAALKQTFAELDLENYLNKQSLNQAQIQVAFERTNQQYELIFKESEWAGKFYDVDNDWLIDYIDESQEEKRFVTSLDKAMNDYVTQYERNGLVSFHGIVVFITDIRKNPANNEGAASKVRPVKYRGVLIYKTDLTDKESYVHEIGHALGLDHSFWRDAEYKEKQKEYIDRVRREKSNILKFENNRDDVFPFNIELNKKKVT